MIVRMTVNYKLRSFVCAGCGSQVQKRCRPGSKYCSQKCYRSSARPDRKTGVSSVCGQCGVEIYVQESARKDQNFCSKACHNAYQGRTKTTHACKVCGSEFKWSPSRSKNQNPTYCSIACRNKCPDWKTSAVIAGNLKQQNSKAPTRLEVAGYAILDAAGVRYERQVLVAGKFTVDAVVSGKNIVIQWDGNYWHGYRAANDNTPLDARQAKRSALDKSQDAYMAKCGYVVLRFWEHEVFNQPEKVREAIQSAIRQSAA